MPENSADHLELWRDRLQDLVDGALDEKDSAAVSEHLKTCGDCGREHARLALMDEQLRKAFAVVPDLSVDFSSRVFASIDAAEELRKSAAKQRAEVEFQNRMRAFDLNWQDLWQRHMGSIVAALSVIGALVAVIGSRWNMLSAEAMEKIPLHSILQSFAGSALSFAVIPITLSAAALWILRTKTR